MNEKNINKAGYGECQICGYVGTIQAHHLIPKKVSSGRQRMVTVQKLNHRGTLSLYKFHIMSTTNLCADCHKKIHPENINFYVKKDELIKLIDEIYKNNLEKFPDSRRTFELVENIKKEIKKSKKIFKTF